MIRKIKLIETLENLPEEFSIDELIDRLIIIQNVEEAQKQSKIGFKYSEEEAKNMITKWSQIIWIKRAIEDLNDIANYIAKDSPKYADLTIDKIFNKTQLLKENSQIGRVVPEIKDTKIRELIEGNFRIIYEIKGSDIIEILTIQHSSKLLKR